MFEKVKEWFLDGLGWLIDKWHEDKKNKIIIIIVIAVILSIIFA